MRVLIIEDNALIADSLAVFLRLEGHTVDFVGDGLAALTHLDAPSVPLPDVILLDLRMPGMDGEEFLERIQEHPAWVSIPIIVDTAASKDKMSDVRQKWPRVKMLQKPFDPQQLLAILKEIEVVA